MTQAPATITYLTKLDEAVEEAFVRLAGDDPAPTRESLRSPCLIRALAQERDYRTQHAARPADPYLTITDARGGQGDLEWEIEVLEDELTSVCFAWELATRDHLARYAD